VAAQLVASRVVPSSIELFSWIFRYVIGLFVGSFVTELVA
jgi:hypothetical protein